MTLYAGVSILADGEGRRLVLELYTPPSGVPISDCFAPLPDRTWIDCSSVAGIQQGWTYDGSTFVAPPAPPAPTAQQAAAEAYDGLIAAGLTITSTGTSALDGIYPIDPQSQGDIATEAQFISTFSEFTNGGTVALPWFLANGAAVSFPTTGEFLAFAKVAAQTVAAAKVAAAQGQPMPAANATIP